MDHTKKRSPPLPQEEDRRFASQAAQAKEYLESHELLPFVRALLQTVIRDRPNDPYNFIADQFRLAASAVIKPCQPSQAESNDAGAAFSEPLLKNVIPEEAPAAPSVTMKAEHNLPIFAQRTPPIEESMEQPADVESLRLQVRDALGEAVEDGRLQKFMEEAASQPFAAKAEPLVVQRKSPPPLPKAKIVPQEAWRGKTGTALEAQMDPLTGEARLARMPVSIEENAVEEAQGPLDAMSVGSHEDDLKLAKAHATGLPESFDFQALNVEEARKKREETTAMDSGAQATHLPESPAVVEEVPQQREETTISVAQATDLPVSPATEESGVKWSEGGVVTVVGHHDVNMYHSREKRRPSVWHKPPTFRPATEEVPQQREETTISVAQATDLPVSPATEEPRPKEDTTAIDSGANDLPVSPTAEEVLLPERLERLRQKAQEALLQGAQSGELWSLLQRHAAQKAQSELLEASRSGRLQGALKQLQPEVEQIRQHAVESLVTAARSGRLLQTLQCTMKCSDLQRTRKESREMVAAAADSGRLEEALRDARLQPEGGDLETLRLLTREAMLMAAQSGELAHVLESVTGQPGQGAQPGPQGPGKNPSHPMLRKQDTPESSILDLSEVGAEPSERPSVHTMVAERIVQELRLAADKEAVRQRNLDIKEKAGKTCQTMQFLGT
eukprot:s4257_g1.t7